MLPVSNLNKIDSRLQGIMLKSQLYGRAKDLCVRIPCSIIASEKGCDAIFSAIHKPDPCP